MKFKDKNVVITGASSGIGEVTSYLFAKNGANIALIARSIDKLHMIKKTLEERYKGQKFIAIKCDVSNKEDVFNMRDQVLDNFKYVDVLVNNAGFAIFEKVVKVSIEDIERQIATNLLGAIYCTKAFLPSMLERGEGHIVNVASLAASIGIPMLAAYCSSKFGLLGFSQSLYHELHGTGVRVSVVSPIAVRTNFFRHESFKRLKMNSKFMLEPETVAKAILKAATSRRLEITVPFYARFAVWLFHTFPYLINPIIDKMFNKY